jgi:hypothetical protein
MGGIGMRRRQFLHATLSTPVTASLSRYAVALTDGPKLSDIDAYGAGLQGKFGQFALRAEYERINASGGDPALSSVGILWRF